MQITRRNLADCIDTGIFFAAQFGWIAVFAGKSVRTYCIPN
jgi:hypothetical protein